MKDENDTQTIEFVFHDSATPDKKAGRPRKFADSAARQAAYRSRIKEEGNRRVVTRTIRRVAPTIPLASSVIDLTACRRW